jgi:hypothetical protein
MTDRRRLVFGAAAVLAVGPALAQAARGRVIAFGITGEVTATNAGRFFAAVRRNIGNAIYLNVVGDKPLRPGPAFDFDVADGANLMIRHQSSRIVTTKPGFNTFFDTGTRRQRFVCGWHYDCVVDRTDGDPNQITLLPFGLDASYSPARFPTLKL